MQHFKLLTRLDQWLQKFPLKDFYFFCSATFNIKFKYHLSQA